MSEESEKGGRPGTLRFTGQPKTNTIDFRLSHPVGYLDDELADTMREALQALAQAIGRERTQTVDGLSAEETAVREALLGFGILAFNEARAFLIVAGAGIDCHARIHFRSIMEYEFRVRRIIDDPSRASEFLDAFAHELRKVADDLELQDENALEAEIEAVLGKPLPQNASTSEKRALFGKGGDVKTAMAELPDGRRRYAGTFAWPSQIAHGSVMALRDVARSTEGRTRDFLDAAGRDGYGNHLSYILIWTILHLANSITMRFESAVLAVMDPIIKRATKVNERLQFVTPEQEARALDLRAKATRTVSGLG